MVHSSSKSGAGRLGDVDQNRVLGVPLGEGARAQRRERVDVAAHVDALPVLFDRRVPRPLRDGTHARHDARRHLRDQLHAAAVVEDLHDVVVGDAAGLGVDRVDEHVVGEMLSQPREVVEGRVDAPVPVVAVAQIGRAHV